MFRTNLKPLEAILCGIFLGLVLIFIDGNFVHFYYKF